MVATAGVVANIAPARLVEKLPLVADDVVADVDLGNVVEERYVQHETVVGPRTELQFARLHRIAKAAAEYCILTFVFAATFIVDYYSEALLGVWGKRSNCCPHHFQRPLFLINYACFIRQTDCLDFKSFSVSADNRLYANFSSCLPFRYHGQLLEQLNILNTILFSLY